MSSPHALITSAKFSSHVMLRSIGFLESLQGQAFGTLLKQGMLDYWLAVEGREIARSETMLYLFTTIKDWWQEYLSAHQSSAAQIAGPTDELKWLEPSSYPEYKEFVSSFKPTTAGFKPPKLLYRAAACVALNEMENNAYYLWNHIEFAARIARVLLNNTAQRVLAILATDEFMEMSDRANGWAMSLLRDVELDASSDFCKPLINGSFEFQGRPRWQAKAPVAVIPVGVKVTPTGVMDWGKMSWSSPGASKQATADEKAIADAKQRHVDPATVQRQRTRCEESLQTLQAISRTSAMQIDCSCTTQFTHDQVGKAVSLYDFAISIQADAGNLLRTEKAWGQLPYGPIGAYARVYGIAVWPVLGAGFSLDKSVPSGKDLDASTSLSRGVSSSVSNEESSTLSSNVDANAGPQGMGGGVSEGFSQTRGITRTDGTDQSLQVSIPHVDFLNHRIESREGTTAPLIVFRMAPPFEPDLNASRVVKFCKDLALKRMDETYTQKELVNGTQGVENFFDDSAQLGPVTLQAPRDSSIECFQQTCAFSFSRDDERFGVFFRGSQVRFRVQFIVGVAHAHASNPTEPPKEKDFGARLTDYVLGQKDDSMGKKAAGLPGRENVFMRDFIFDLVIDVP